MREGVNKVALRLFEHNEKAYHAAVWMMGAIWQGRHCSSHRHRKELHCV